MTQNESGGGANGRANVGDAAAGDSSGEMLKLARSATARIVTAALEATAESADMEQTARRRRPTASAPLSEAMRVDPEQIHDFTRSDAYQDLIERYIAGRLDGHLLTRALDLLRSFLPPLFAR